VLGEAPTFPPPTPPAPPAYEENRDDGGTDDGGGVDVVDDDNGGSASEEAAERGSDIWGGRWSGAAHRAYTRREKRNGMNVSGTDVSSAGELHNSSD
jgi:hypothetical protein